MLLAYNTNGLAHHDLIDAIGLLAEIGFQGVAITLDHGVLNPFDERTGDQLERVAKALELHRMRCVIETGARYLLDPRRSTSRRSFRRKPQAGRGAWIFFAARSTLRPGCGPIAYRCGLESFTTGPATTKHFRDWWKDFPKPSPMPIGKESRWHLSRNQEC